MLSNKTQELFTQFLASLKEDTGLEPESCMIAQYDHYGNTSEAKALQLVNDFNFIPRESNDTNWVRKEEDKLGKCSLTFTYFYRPEEAEEEETLYTCERCQGSFEKSEMIDDQCERCNEKTVAEGEEEQQQLEKEYYRSRL